MLIDTHKTIKNLTGAGVPESHAEAIVRAITTAGEQVATKQDLEEWHTALQRDIEALQRDIEELRAAIEQVREANQRDIGDLRTDIEDLRADLQLDNENLRADLQRDIENVRQEILKTFWRGLFTATALIIAAMALLLALFA